MSFHLKIEAKPAVEWYRIQIACSIVRVESLEVRAVQTRLSGEWCVEAEISAETEIIFHSGAEMGREILIVNPNLLISLAGPFSRRIVN